MFCCYLVSYYILFSGLLKHELHVAADLQIPVIIYGKIDCFLMSYRYQQSLQFI